MNEELAALTALSHELGTDPSLVQGPGGNTSCKVREVDTGETTIWVKASGAWLEHAREREIFVPVRHESVMDMIAAGEEKLPPDAMALGGPEGLRPSIETTLHALMPHCYVAHTHAVNTIATVCLANPRTTLEQRLGDIDFAFVPYCRPGLPLTLEVQRTLAELGDVDVLPDAAGTRAPDMLSDAAGAQAPDMLSDAAGARAPDVLILGNHGLVVGADSAESALTLTREVESRLHIESRTTRKTPNLAALEGLLVSDGWRVPTDGVNHAVAHDPDALAVATAGSLYPDHVIFLGHAITTTEPSRDVNDDSLAVVVPNAGVLVRESCPPAADWMVHALSEITTRLHPDNAIHYLSHDDEAALLNWDAEKYRQRLARGHN